MSHCEGGSDSTMTEQEYTATVSEDKFQGTGIYTVVAPDKDKAKSFAKKYFRDHHNTGASKVIAEQKDMAFDKNTFEVMVSNQSSGSLQPKKMYEMTEDGLEETKTAGD